MSFPDQLYIASKASYPGNLSLQPPHSHPQTRGLPANPARVTAPGSPNQPAGGRTWPSPPQPSTLPCLSLRSAMVDMGGLDNLMANTAYLQARKTSEGDSRELQRRRRSLALPGPQSCAPLRQALPPDFHSLCEQQPVGRRLFRDFLATVPRYREAMAFVEQVQSWELAEGPAKGGRLQALVAAAGGPAPGHPPAFLSPALSARCLAATTEDERAALVALARAEAMAFLQGQPFRDFLASPFYDQFLRWKVFEMQPVSDKYFTEFRVLGKGGFGEVSVSEQPGWKLKDTA